MASQYDLPYTGPQVEALLAKISELESEMPSKTSDLTNDSGFITSTDVPTKTSDLNNDSGFITNAPVAAEAARAQAAEALLATISSLQAEITRATGVEGTLQDLIDGIAAKIPSAATGQNQLADKAFVNSSIATATAEFRGTYNSLAELQAVSADENDYGYVRTTDAAGNTIFKRYKYASGSWVFEYDLNNSSFTASQWAAINSAITAELVAKLSALPDNATLTAALAAKQDIIDDLSSIRSKADSAYQKPSGGIPASDIADGVIPDIADNLTTNDATKVLSAKQGKVLNENLTQLGQELNGTPIATWEVYDYSGLPTYMYSINSQNKWISSSASLCSLVPITPGKQYKVTEVDGLSIIIAILKSDAHNVGNIPEFSDSYPARIPVAAGSVYEFTAPADAYCLYLVRKTTSGNPAPKLEVYKEEIQPGLIDRVESLEDTTSELEISSIVKKQVDITDCVERVYTINSAGNWLRSGGSKWIKAIPGAKYIITAGTYQTVVAAIAEYPNGDNNIPAVFATGWTARQLVAAGSSYSFICPDDAVAIYVLTKDSSNNNTTPAVFITSSVNDAVSDLLDFSELAYDKPESLGVLNALKKANQMAKVRWTPVASTMPWNKGTFVQGKEYEGIPYSSVKEYNQFIFEEVSLETFMTAVRNPRSVLYTEDVSSSNSRSALGRTYHGSNGACYYGSVCSGLTTFAYGLPQNVTTFEFRNWSEMEEVQDQSAYGVRLADLIWKDGHLKMVVAIGRDHRGLVRDIETFENVNQKTVSSHYKADAFNATLQSYGGDYVIMRYKKLYENRTYVPQTKFVQVYGEEVSLFKYNEDLCPNYGDKSNYNEGDNIVLNLRTDYADAGFDTLNVYKDDVLLISREISGVDETLTGLEYGDYKANLTGETAESDYVYFKVVNAAIEKVENSFTFSSANATPVYYEFCSQNGARASISGDIVGLTTRMFTESELLAGVATPTEPVVADGIYRFLKVHFETDYGRVIRKLTW